MTGRTLPDAVEMSRLNGCGDDRAVLTAVRLAERSASGADAETQLAVVEVPVTALGNGRPQVRRAAAEALATLHRGGTLDQRARLRLLSFRQSIEAPHVDQAGRDSFERTERGRSRYHADYPVHTDYGIGVRLEPDDDLQAGDKPHGSR